MSYRANAALAASIALGTLLVASAQGRHRTKVLLPARRRLEG